MNLQSIPRSITNADSTDSSLRETTTEFKFSNKETSDWGRDLGMLREEEQVSEIYAKERDIIDVRTDAPNAPQPFRSNPPAHAPNIPTSSPHSPSYPPSPAPVPDTH